jgi:hypothetical protein
MHARGCTVVVSYGVEAHVLGVRDAGLQLGHDVIHTLLEKGPGGRQVCGRWRHWMRTIAWCGRGQSGHGGREPRARRISRGRLGGLPQRRGCGATGVRSPEMEIK